MRRVRSSPWPGAPRLLRRIVCNLRPGWHRGFVRRQLVLPHNFGLSYTPVVYWTRPVCVDCGETEY